MIDWVEVQKALTPVKNFEDLCHRLQGSFGYPFVSEVFNITLAELEIYTHRLLGGDSKGRYSEYVSRLTGILSGLQKAGVVNVLDLLERTSSRQRSEAFVGQSGIPATEIVMLLKYLIYWFIPSEKYLSGLVRDDPDIQAAIKALSRCGIRTNLQLLQAGISLAGRKDLAIQCGLSLKVINQLVNRADFSRLPWSSKATISNIIGAGYTDLASLANANPERLYTDFFAYGRSIGKNLKLGNEIENSYRIAKIVPVLVQGDLE